MNPQKIMSSILVILFALTLGVILGATLNQACIKERARDCGALHNADDWADFDICYIVTGRKE